MTETLRVSIVQGRYDILCPPEVAWELHKALPNSELHLIAGCGHSAGVSPKPQNTVRFGC